MIRPPRPWLVETGVPPPGAADAGAPDVPLFDGVFEPLAADPDPSEPRDGAAAGLPDAETADPLAGETGAGEAGTPDEVEPRPEGAGENGTAGSLTGVIEPGAAGASRVTDAAVGWLYETEKGEVVPGLGIRATDRSAPDAHDAGMAQVSSAAVALPSA